MRLRFPGSVLIWFGAFKLSIILTVVAPLLPEASFAQGQCSSIFLSHIAKTDDEAIKPQDRVLGAVTTQQAEAGFPDLVNDESYYGLLSARRLSVQIKRTDSWGVPREFEGKGIEVSIPVTNRSEGNAVLKYLLDSVGIDSSSLRLNPGKFGADLPNGIYAYFEKPRETAGGIEPSLRLILTNKRSASLEAGEALIQSLINKGLYRKESSEIHFNMNSNTGRHEWAVYSFKGNRNLSRDELRALDDLGGSEYRTINSSLRDGHNRIDPRIPFIDSAINKGTVDRPVKIYRSVQREDLNTLWERMNNNENLSPEITPDPAYLFGSLDPEVAKWWQNYDRRAEGIILEIEMPAGSHAAYIDSRIIERRGYLEIVLPRNAKFTALSATKDGNYRILRVRLHN